MQMIGKNSLPELSLYIHVPFCEKKCPYCHFYSIEYSQKEKDNYLAALFEEISSYKEEIFSSQIVSLYFGGGTPCLLCPAEIEQILEKLQIKKDAKIEITLEVNPHSVSLKTLQDFYQVGINRLSIGIQSFDESLLKTLLRTHLLADNYAAIENANAAGFKNISIDLMYDLPGQSLQMWESTLEIAGSLPITHISLYNLVIEPKTAWHYKKEMLSALMPDEETSYAMYALALEKTASKQFSQYEISAFAKDGYRSIHNIGYWKGRSFLGFGPSAWSYYNGKRYANPSSLSAYKKIVQTKDRNREIDIPPSERAKELLVIGLRMNEGVDIEKLESSVSPLPKITKDTIQLLSEKGLLFQKNTILQMSERGRYVYDSIAVELL